MCRPGLPPSNCQAAVYCILHPHHITIPPARYAEVLHAHTGICFVVGGVLLDFNVEVLTLLHLHARPACDISDRFEEEPNPTPQCCVVFQVNGYASAMAGQMIKGDVIMELREHSSAGVEKVLVELQEAVQRYSGEALKAEGKTLKPTSSLRKASPHIEEEGPSSSNGLQHSQGSSSDQQRTCIQKTPVVAPADVRDGSLLNGARPSAESSTELTCLKQQIHCNPEQDHGKDGLSSYAALQNEYEPRARLLWTTIAKVTSVEFPRLESLPEPKAGLRPPEGKVSG